MQDIHSIGGGRIFCGGGGGGGGVGDRRLRPNHHHQALKCPRCDSLNTKFCYYNNYNLSQPRHFCKNCRRYWTKGGVLRNVPIGGGCRKAKRSKTKPTSEFSPSAAVESPQKQQQELQHDEHKSNSHSSSESSSFTAANSNIPMNNNSNNNNNNTVSGAAEAMSKFFGNPNIGFQPGMVEQGSAAGGIFSEIGNFTGLINSSNSETLSFGFGTGLNGGNGENGGGLFDRTATVESSNLHTSSEGEGCGGFGPLDWQGSGDQGLFDLPNAVDHSYWSQSQWTDQDHPTLYIP